MLRLTLKLSKHILMMDLIQGSKHWENETPHRNLFLAQYYHKTQNTLGNMTPSYPTNIQSHDNSPFYYNGFLLLDYHILILENIELKHHSQLHIQDNFIPIFFNTGVRVEILDLKIPFYFIILYIWNINIMPKHIMWSNTLYWDWMMIFHIL
jgi:hypothetical protein